MDKVLAKPSIIYSRQLLKSTVLCEQADTVESGAVKLAWAAFLSLAKSMITGISQADEQAMTAF